MPEEAQRENMSNSSEANQPVAAAGDSTSTTASPPAPQSPSDDQAAGEGCAALILLALIGLGAFLFYFSEIPSGYRFSFGREKLDASQFSFQIYDQILFHDKYIVGNNSQHDLSEVHIWFSTKFLNGANTTSYRYWHSWPAASYKRCDTPLPSGESPSLIEKVTVYVCSDKFFFSRTFGAK